MPSVLITRPRETAEPLAAELERLGYRAVIEPLLSIKPLVALRPPGGLPDAVIITSGSALQALADRREQITDLLNLPCFCVGPRTAEKATAFGFQRVQNAEGGGAELARLTGPMLGKKHAIVFHLAGNDTDRKAQQELEKQGHRVVVWPVYEAIPVTVFTAEARELLERGQLAAVVVFSPRTAEVLAKLLADAALEACCASVAAICLSDAIAGVLKFLKWRQIAAASVPSEKAVIACLQEICPVKS
jgi:uroporphyrinogen-III synthase